MLTIQEGAIEQTLHFADAYDTGSFELFDASHQFAPSQPAAGSATDILGVRPAFPEFTVTAADADKPEATHRGRYALHAHSQRRPELGSSRRTPLLGDG